MTGIVAGARTLEREGSQGPKPSTGSRCGRSDQRGCSVTGAELSGV
jgi:hypothetical protein